MINWLIGRRISLSSSKPLEECLALIRAQTRSWLTIDFDPDSHLDADHGYLGPGVRGWTVGNWVCLWSDPGRAKPLLIARLIRFEGTTIVRGRLGVREGTIWIALFLLATALIMVTSPSEITLLELGVVGLVALALLLFVQRWGGNGEDLADFVEHHLDARAKSEGEWP